MAHSNTVGNVDEVKRIDQQRGTVMPFCGGGLRVVNSPASTSPCRPANCKCRVGRRSGTPLYKLALEADRGVLRTVGLIAVPVR
jgi:hypothetical protein